LRRALAGHLFGCVRVYPSAARVETTFVIPWRRSRGFER
jgi:hypothetical protein